VPRPEAVALAPEQVAVLLDAADRSPSPWLGPWTVLAAATGARNGEPCGLEWADLDLDAGTVQFRQALTIIDPTVLLDDADGDGAGMGGGRKELAVGPLKSTASSAILTLPPFAVQALRRHRRQQHRLRLALGQAPTLWLRWVEPGQPPRPVQLDLAFRTERGTPVNPNHASRAFARLATSTGVAAHPHLLRHALASAMAANKEPASIIAAQLRHADGGALAQRVYIHQLPQTAPRLAGVIEGVFGPEAREGRAVSAGRRLEGKWRETQCRRFYRSHRGLPADPLLSPPGPEHCSDVHKRPAGSFGRHSASLPVSPCPARPSLERREVGGKSRLRSDHRVRCLLPPRVR
jgi:integrase